jgi:DNA sulfur modification protein DndD
MHLVEAHLRNWRSYRNVTFKFPLPASGRNVTLVGAQNGTGKTSLLIALYLGLFGREAMHLIEGVSIAATDEDRGSTYRNLLERIIHRPALGSSDDVHTLVRLRFQAPDGSQTAISRRWNFSRIGRVRDLNTRDGEEVTIEIDGDPRIYRTWQEANDRIAELLFPSNVMPCFFFDGEQAQERVEAAGGRALLDAVNTLYGTGMIDQLKQSLVTYINNERAALRRDVGNVREDELDQRREELDREKLDLEKVTAELTEKRREREEWEGERQRHTNDLHQLIGDSAADIEEYATSIKALEGEQLTLRKALTDGLASLALPLALARNGQKVAEVVTAEQIRDRWLLLKEEATGKAERIIARVLPTDGGDPIEPPLVEEQLVVLRRRLETALEALWSPPPHGCAEEYQFSFLREADRAAILSKIERLRKAGVPDVAEAAINWRAVNTRLRETQRKFDSIRDIQPRLKSLKEAIKEATENINRVIAELNSHEIRERGIGEKIKDLRAAIGQMEKKRSIADPVQEKIDVAYRVTEVIDGAKERLIPLCKEALEERCTFHFSQMISDEYKNFDVKFDAEPRLENAEQAIYVTSLSGAQKRAFGLAFTLAVADVSGQQAPIVIDTPVGNMDSKYRDRVLRYVAKAAPGQVIFLSHDEEISEAYKKRLSPAIQKTILVTFEQTSEGSGVSSLSEDKYFGDA